MKIHNNSIIKSSNLIKKILLYLNNLIQIFPKDYIAKWDPIKNIPITLDFIPFKEFEMFYGVDIMDNLLYCRYSNYITNKNKGIIVFDINRKLQLNHIRLSDDNVYFRLFNHTILELRKYEHQYGLYQHGSNKLLISSKEDTFELIKINDKHLILIDNIVYKISINFEFQPIADLNPIMSRYSLRGLSMDFDIENDYFVCVAISGKYAAINTILVEFNLDEKYELISDLIQINMENSKKRLGIHGVSSPLIRVRKSQNELYFSYFWGHHFLQFKTLNYWKNVLYKN